LNNLEVVSMLGVWDKHPAGIFSEVLTGIDFLPCGETHQGFLLVRLLPASPEPQAICGPHENHTPTLQYNAWRYITVI
jgi:hypothetical protein